MVDRFERLRKLTPPRDIHTLWVEMDEETVHAVDGAFAMSDGVANVRREYREIGGKKFFKIYVASGCLSQALEVLDKLRKWVRIGEIRVEG